MPKTPQEITVARIQKALESLGFKLNGTGFCFISGARDIAGTLDGCFVQVSVSNPPDAEDA